MKAVIEKGNDKVTIRADCRAGDGKKHVEKVELKTHDTGTVKYVERKLVEKGVGRLDRRPVDGLPRKHDPKKGHGGKYTWEGPEKEFEAESTLDEVDLNYVEEAAADSEVSGLVVGEVEVAKAAPEGVARIEVDPHLNLN